MQSTRDRELREAKEKLTTTYRPALTEEQKPVIPAPKIFADLTCASSDLDNIPTTAQCAVHLEFLEKVVQLKQKVLTSNALDRAFRLVPADKLVTRKGKREVEADAKFKERQAVKWPVFVRIGAARFLKWWKACSAWLPIGDHAIILDEDILPPIGLYLKNFSRFGLMGILRCSHGVARLSLESDQVRDFLQMPGPGEDAKSSISLAAYCELTILF